MKYAKYDANIQRTVMSESRTWNYGQVLRPTVNIVHCVLLKELLI